MSDLLTVYKETKKEREPVESFADVIIASGANAVLEKNVDAPKTESDVESGAPFSVPLLIPEGVESGDGRFIAKGGLTTRDLPLPLLWQVQTADGHGGSVIVGKIDSVERTGEGLGLARGVFDTGEWGREAERLVRGGFLRGVSADLDNFQASAVDSEELSADDEEEIEEGVQRISAPKLRIDSARVIAATLVAKPAFQECTIELVADELRADEQTDDPAILASLETATDPTTELATTPATPPAAWFTDPKLDRPTPVQVTPEGQVFGHIAAWDQDHIGLPNNVRPPRSRSNYAFFTTGAVTTAEGTDVPVGNLTLSGGHAPLNADAMSAVKHYDDTASAVADVAAGEDVYGIWIAGSIRPGSTVAQVRSLKASAPSGDWRPIKGRLELVAVCQVNVPGFPIPRTSSITASGQGQISALVAAGADYMAAVRQQENLEALAASAKNKVQTILDEETRKENLKIDKEFAIARMQNLI